MKHSVPAPYRGTGQAPRERQKSMEPKLTLKNDKYKKARGGRSCWLELSCEKCKNKIVTYQKDGPGILKRLYIDRMIGKNIPTGKDLTCSKCKTLLGVWIIYKKENRPAYRLFAGAVEKKVISK
jgi:hypothetical protein